MAGGPTPNTALPGALAQDQDQLSPEEQARLAWLRRVQQAQQSGAWQAAGRQAAPQTGLLAPPAPTQAPPVTTGPGALPNLQLMPAQVGPGAPPPPQIQNMPAQVGPGAPPLPQITNMSAQDKSAIPNNPQEGGAPMPAMRGGFTGGPGTTMQLPPGAGSMDMYQRPMLPNEPVANNPQSNRFRAIMQGLAPSTNLGPGFSTALNPIGNSPAVQDIRNYTASVLGNRMPASQMLPPRGSPEQLAAYRTQNPPGQRGRVIVRGPPSPADYNLPPVRTR